MENFLHFYQTIPLKISPEIFSLGPLSVRWYSLGYIFGFLTFVFFMRLRIKKQEVHLNFSSEKILDIGLYVFLGVLIGGRIGYALFYQFEYYFFHPLEIILPFRETSDGWRFVGIAGMSYHGGVLGFIGGVWLYCKTRGLSLLNMLDLGVAPAALGYTFGRLGNFMNGELYGRATAVPWGMYFLGAEDGLPFSYLRHPSQLYEAFFEGIVVFCILWGLRNKRFKAGMQGALYLFFYGFFRFFIEFFRQPDSHFASSADELGTVFYWMSMGQVLCLVMMAASAFLMVYFNKLAYPSLLYPGASSGEKKIEYARVSGKKKKKRKKKKR